MSCPSCAPATEVCTTVYPQLNPCRCDDSPAGIEEIGPTGTTGPKGETPVFIVGTVGSGGSFIEVVETGYATRSVNWILPAVPEGVPYTWTDVNTFERPSNFEQGLQTTGGESIFGGSSFIVTPDASFAATIDVAGNSNVGGNLALNGIFNEDGNITVEGDTTLNDVEFFHQTNLENATLSTLIDISEYPSGFLVIGSCLNPEKQPNRGGSTYQKAQATGLTPVGPVDSDAICNPVVINIAVSDCVPQVTPIMDVVFRVGYRFGNPGIFSNFNATLWQGGIGSTQLDFYTQGDGIFNSNAGFFELYARATLVAGNNSFVVEVANTDASEDFTPTSVTYWFRNI